MYAIVEKKVLGLAETKRINL